MKKFDVPSFYRSSIIGKIKQLRKLKDPKKQDSKPFLLDLGPVKFYIPRHFGFCYGVENAIEIAYKTIEEHRGKNIFLLSEMIHNPAVNEDLMSRGVRFIKQTNGKQLIPWTQIKPDDIVIIPAFGTTLETKSILKKIGVNTEVYNTTCPFVEKVWKASSKLSKRGYTVIIHGKATHEETRATFSHTQKNTHTLVIRDIEEARQLASIMLGHLPIQDFYTIFQGKYSQEFNPARHLQRIGVVNQTTMLATETLKISELLKNTIASKYGQSNYKAHFADTRNTLCYATNDNQNATYKMLEQTADLALVIGGYNSSNTSHIVDLCMEKLPTYFISSHEKILDKNTICHFNLSKKVEVLSKNFLPNKDLVSIHITSGASCPDSTVDAIIRKLVSFYPNSKSVEQVLRQYPFSQT